MAVTPPTTSFAPTAMASSSSSSPPAKAHKLYNLILPISLSRGQVLLGYKLRGFGIGKYNGFGGKVEAGETIVASAVRELREESGMVCTENQLQHQAVLLLETVASGAEHEKVLEIHVFVCTEWSGEIAETDEMRPEWYSPEKLPLNQMWEETRIWMATMLQLYLPHHHHYHHHCGTSLPTEVAGGNGGEDGGEKKWFIHYVDFCGDINAQTGQWDPWHGMGTSVWQWFDKPLEGWSRPEIVAWVDRVRSRRSLPN